MGRAKEHGGALMITLLLTVGLIAGGAVLLRMQLVSTSSAGLVTEEITALNCAEAGVVAARPLVAANVAGWNTASLCNPPPPRGTGGCVIGTPISEPAWLSAMPHDLDGDGTNDVVVSLVDNDDETPSDLTVDTDQTIHIISTCNIRGSHAQVTELVHYDTATSSLTRKLWMRTE